MVMLQVFAEFKFGIKLFPVVVIFVRKTKYDSPVLLGVTKIFSEEIEQTSQVSPRVAAPAFAYIDIGDISGEVRVKLEKPPHKVGFPVTLRNLFPLRRASLDEIAKLIYIEPYVAQLEPIWSMYPHAVTHFTTSFLF